MSSSGSYVSLPSDESSDSEDDGYSYTKLKKDGVPAKWMARILRSHRGREKRYNEYKLELERKENEKKLLEEGARREMPELSATYRFNFDRDLNGLPFDDDIRRSELIARLNSRLRTNPLTHGHYQGLFLYLIFRRHFIFLVLKKYFFLFFQNEAWNPGRKPRVI
jgi:hypothetical protein